MRVKLILPALTEATSPFFRPIKYALFPPLGLATLAAHLDPDDTITLMDDDGPEVFERTVDWAIRQGIETATFHILTPYPGTALHARMEAEGRITSQRWDRYDTRHVVFRPARLSPEELEAGYWRAYRDFYRWGSILSGASTKGAWGERLRHVAYAGGWKKLEPLWDLVIRARRVTTMLPMLEGVLSGFGRHATATPGSASDRAMESAGSLSVG